MSLGAVGLDATVLNTALPTISTALHASTSQLQWFVDAYNLVLAAVLLPAGLLGDRFGRKKMMLGALALFGAGSLWCACAHTSATLIAARVVLGLGGAFLIPLCLSVLLVLFEPHERQRAVSGITAVNMLALPLGPIVGGVLLKHFWWGSVFLINVPVVVIGLVAVATLVPESRTPTPSRLDLIGVVISALGMVALTYGVIEAGGRGFADAHTLGTLAGGAAALVLFVRWERRVARHGVPLVDLALFRSRGFTWGTILAIVVSFAMFGLLFNIPQYLQAVLGTDSLGTGLRLLPMAVGLVVGIQGASRLTSRTGPKTVAALGFTAVAAGLLIGTQTRSDSPYGLAAGWIAVFGVGLGLTMSTATVAALSTVPKERSGAGSALIMALRQLGSAIGVAVLGSLANSIYRAHLDTHGLPEPVAHTARSGVSAGAAEARRIGSTDLLASARSAFIHGMDVTLWVCAAIGVAGLLLTLVALPGRPRPAVPTADASAAYRRATTSPLPTGSLRPSGDLE
jgi:EmrB/QacA subfamily drug resistance transporter